MQNQEYIRKIRRSAAIGLWGSVAAIIIVSLFHYVSPYQFYPSAYTSQWMLIAGSVLAVLAVSMSLLVIRRQIPALRQSDSLDAKLEGYASHVRSIYYTLFAVVVILCIFMVLSTRGVLLMLAIVTVLMLFLAYPNIYRIKVDLGLNDDEMKSLFGDKYIANGDNAAE